MTVLTNVWVVGIGTGILSGLLVRMGRAGFLSKRENRKYQKVIGANREVIYAIRPGIPEGQIPSREVVQALTNSTARRAGVSPSDLYKPNEIAEELIKEVMDSSFLPSAKKSEYCTQLAALRSQPPDTHTHEAKAAERERSQLFSPNIGRDGHKW